MKKHNYIITLKARTATDLLSVSQRISQLIPDAVWVENTSSFLLKKLDEEAIIDALEQVGGKRCYLEYYWKHDLVEGSPKYLRQQIRQIFSPYHSAYFRNVFLLFSGGFLIIGAVVISLLAANTASQYSNVIQILSKVVLFLAVFLVTLFQSWVFDEDEESFLKLAFKALLVALAATVLARQMQEILVS